ncbi:hypothetical protein E2C01_034428 [Portunus trituberculatus]|uniref:Uncharacterized protein n=1 Tax=Portunus trituberculatus TaxID=210409 RepID=A0A5B7F5I6_PORTR|nr:hypothetical protein [Portunus trituberculatus]
MMVQTFHFIRGAHVCYDLASGSPYIRGNGFHCSCGRGRQSGESFLSKALLITSAFVSGLLRTRIGGAR